MTDEPRNVRRKLHSRNARSLTSAIAGQPETRFPWQINWIDFRHSLVTVFVREDRGETVLVCGSCGCETDVVPVPHSPRCGATA